MPTPTKATATATQDLQTLLVDTPLEEEVTATTNLETMIAAMMTPHTEIQAMDVVVDMVDQEDQEDQEGQEWQRATK